MSTPRLGLLPGTADKRRQIRKLYGRPSPLIDPAPVRAHIDYLRGWGLSCAAIAEAAGISADAVKVHVAGQRSRIHRRYATAILGVGLAPHPAQTRPLADGARRRVQALAVAGWPLEVQGQRFGLHSKGALVEVISNPTLLARYHWGLVELYDELSMKRGPSNLTSRRAIRRRWVPALAWDEDTIDDPTAKPDLGRRGRTGSGRCPVVDLAEVEHLREGGCSDEEIAARLGVKVISIERAEYRAAARGAAS